MTESVVAEAGRPRSKKGKQAYEGNIVRPIDEIPIMGGGTAVEVTGSWAYFLRPDGATISEVLTLYPNGGIPDIADERMKVRYGANASYYRERQAAKGFTYIGQTLNENAVRQIVKVLANNREDEILFCEDELANCEHVIASSDVPEVRDQARKRRGAFQRRLDTMRQPLDAEALISELNDIARAQMLASVDPNVMRVMKAMIGEVNDNVASLVSRFQKGKPVTQEEGQPKLSRAGRSTQGSEFSGTDFIDSDS